MIDWDAQIAAARAAAYRHRANACPTCEDGILTIESPTRCRQCVIDKPAPRSATR